MNSVWWLKFKSGEALVRKVKVEPTYSIGFKQYVYVNTLKKT
jgi:hypothetical protein